MPALGERLLDVMETLVVPLGTLFHNEGGQYREASELCEYNESRVIAPVTFLLNS
jgi:hypothetical protein